MPTVLPMNRSDLDSISEIELDGTIYNYRIYWHSLYDRWYLDLKDSTGGSIITGKKLTINGPTLRHRGLKGELFFISLSGDDSPAAVSDLGERVELMYFSESEISRSPVIHEDQGLSDFINLK